MARSSRVPGLSCAYLLLILLSILAQPFAPLELMQQSNL
jgi:hypothetical protein